MRPLMGIMGLGGRSEVERTARARGIPVIQLRSGNDPDAAERLRRLRPDLICIAIFPWILGRDLITAASLGAINLHPSLLPRHRGPLPIFWTYHGDDRLTGVTIHHAIEKTDAGDLILQDSIAVPRGYPAADLSNELAQRGASMLRKAVDLLTEHRAPRSPQNEEQASYAPKVKPGSCMVPFMEWDVERVWHFLAALSPRYREPLKDENGRPVIYQGIAGFERGPTAEPGRISSVEGGWSLDCIGGMVRLTQGTRQSR